MKCPRCDVEMTVGIAIDPKWPDRGLCGPRPLLSYWDIDLIVVLKCPKCGHSDDGK